MLVRRRNYERKQAVGLQKSVSKYSIMRIERYSSMRISQVDCALTVVMSGTKLTVVFVQHGKTGIGR